MRTAVSIGLIGTTSAEVLRVLAPRVERLGFDALWLNDVPGGDSLEGLRAAASVTSSLRLATGVIPLDRRPAASLDLAGLPAERTMLGIGSGRVARPLALVRDGLAELRARTDARLAVGALGPKMRALAAAEGDAVLLNWLTPAAATEATAELRRDALAARGEAHAARSVLYARTITDESARPALEREAEGYERVAAYAANFERLGFSAIEATIADASQLRAYDGTVDELVLRAITPSGSLAELEAFVDRAAAWRAGLG